MAKTKHPSNPEYIGITELVQRINRSLEQDPGVVTFQGEISELHLAASGHLYFQLSDGNSTISAAMWRSSVSRLGFEAEIGMKVVCRGQANVYPKSGRFQIIVQRMQIFGEGLLQKKFLELKARLEKEGLFDESRKRPLPFMPLKLGVVSSKGGAVIHDIMTKVHERLPFAQVYIYDARVQGPGAAEELAAGVEAFNRDGRVEVIIVARGGGSLEDLWAFNEEVLVRAIFASKIPVISGVGHEVDVTLCDLVADYRAPTPTAAAERALPKKSDLLEKVDLLARRLSRFDRWMGTFEQQLDELSLSLKRVAGQEMKDRKLELEHRAKRLAAFQPESLVNTTREKLQRLERSLRNNTITNFQRSQQELRVLEHAFGKALHFNAEEAKIDSLSRSLFALSPVAVLDRGYALARSGGRYLKTASDLEKNSKVDILFAEDTAEVTLVHSKGATELWQKRKLKK